MDMLASNQRRMKKRRRFGFAAAEPRPRRRGQIRNDVTYVSQKLKEVRPK